ncbi:hypothetical protein ACIP4S_25260 [Streptomyces chartreusis]
MSVGPRRFPSKAGAVAGSARFGPAAPVLTGGHGRPPVHPHLRTRWSR